MSGYVSGNTTARDYLIFIFFSSVARLVLPKCIWGPERDGDIGSEGPKTLGAKLHARGAGPSEAGPSEAGPSEVGPSEAGPSEAGPSEAGPSEAGPSEAGPSEAGPSEAGPSEAGAGTHVGGGRGNWAGLGAPPNTPEPLFTGPVLNRAETVSSETARVPAERRGPSRKPPQPPAAVPGGAGCASRGCGSRPRPRARGSGGATGARGGRAARCLSCRPPWPSPLGKARARAAAEEPCAARAAAALPVAAEGPWGRGAVPPSAPPSELQAQLSGVEPLLEEFRRLLQQERPQEEQERELRAGVWLPEEGCPGRGGGGYSATPDAIIRTKDSAAAGARFLSPPATMGDWRPCGAACCSEPRYSMAVVELPRRPASPAAAAALGCCLVNCTARGRSVCKFALHRGYSSCSLCRAFTAGGETGEPHGTRVSTPLEEAGPDLQVLLPWHLLSGAQEETTWAVHFGSRAK
ncbi:spidroin-2-like [Mustela lutreola]|uniref:spidroin-2-like n=1 Tax=Mustela lutreola TaxID=9666 RepID=UPI00279741BA|nr:spidroin-2-like [Mustela lutreola]